MLRMDSTGCSLEEALSFAQEEAPRGVFGVFWGFWGFWGFGVFGGFGGFGGFGVKGLEPLFG